MNDAAKEFQHVAILGGGGLMGHGIALACLQGSAAEVTIISRRQESVDHGLELIHTGPFGIEKAVKRGKLTEDQAGDIRSRLHGRVDYAEGLARADLVFESIPEVVEDKQEALSVAEMYVSDETVFATNTSSMLIAELSVRMKIPERLIGTHWFYPSNVMPLVEVGRSEINSAACLDRVVSYLAQIGKKPVVVRDSPGFFMTRFINNFIAEAIRLVELGIAGPAEVDEMVRTGLGWPMGVFELLDDAAAFDAFYHAQEYLHETCGERYAVPPLARKVFLAGYLGSEKLKPGSRGGWYEFLGVERPPQDGK